MCECIGLLRRRIYTTDTLVVPNCPAFYKASDGMPQCRVCARRKSTRMRSDTVHRRCCNGCYLHENDDVEQHACLLSAIILNPARRPCVSNVKHIQFPFRGNVDLLFEQHGVASMVRIILDQAVPVGYIPLVLTKEAETVVFSFEVSIDGTVFYTKREHILFSPEASNTTTYFDTTNIDLKNMWMLGSFITKLSLEIEGVSEIDEIVNFVISDTEEAEVFR